jgi:hypothetical protein
LKKSPCVNTNFAAMAIRICISPQSIIAVATNLEYTASFGRKTLSISSWP